MSWLSTSWRQSLAATALAAVIGLDAAAEEPPAEAAETVEIELEADVEFIAHDEDGDEEIEAREAELHAAFAELEEEKLKFARRHRGERKKVERRMREIEEALERSDDLPEEEREELELAKRRIHEHMADVERDLRGPIRKLGDRQRELENQKIEMVARRLEMEAHELERHAEKLQQELEGLEEEDADESHEIRARLERIHERHRQIEREHQRLELRAHGRELEHRQHEIQRLHEEGKHDEAEELARDARRMRKELQRRELDERVERRRRDGPGDHARRVEHLRIAAENLDLAGMHDQAEKLMRHADEIARDHGEHNEHRGRGLGSGSGFDPGPGSSGFGGPADPGVQMLKQQAMFLRQQLQSRAADVGPKSPVGRRLRAELAQVQSELKCRLQELQEVDPPRDDRRIDELEETVHGLHQRIDELHRQIERLHEHLEDIARHLNGDEDGDEDEDEEFDEDPVEDADDEDEEDEHADEEDDDDEGDEDDEEDDDVLR